MLNRSARFILATALVVTHGAICSGRVIGQGISATARDGYIEIDGKRNPEKIPEYMMWRSSFRTIAEFMAKNQLQAVDETLHLTTNDRKLVYDASRDQPRRDAECDRLQLMKREEKTRAGAKEADVLFAVQTVSLQCRQQVLDVADRLIESLTPFGQASLLAWVNERRTKIRVWVPKDELTYFNKPR